MIYFWKFWLSRKSVVYTSACAEPCGSRSNPVVLLNVHIFSFPFNLHVITTGSWSNLHNLFLIGTIIGELRVTPEPILWLFFHPLFARSADPVKSRVFKSARRISWRPRYWRSFLTPIDSLFLMLINPKFMSCFIHMEMLNLKMGIVHSCSRCFLG